VSRATRVGDAMRRAAGLTRDRWIAGDRRDGRDSAAWRYGYGLGWAPKSWPKTMPTLRTRRRSPDRL